MKYDEFIANVRAAENLDRQGAEKAAGATLEALSRRLTEDEAKDLAAQLPPELGDHVRAAAPPLEKASLDEFFDKVAELEGTPDRREAERHARAVLGVLSEAVTAGELDDVFSQLPEEYRDLLAPKSV